MRFSNGLLLAALAAGVSTAAQGQVLFSDNFDTTDTTDFQQDIATRQTGTLVPVGGYGLALNNFTSGGSTATGQILNGAVSITGDNNQGPRISVPPNPGETVSHYDFYNDIADQKYSLKADLAVTSLLGDVDGGGVANARVAMTWGYRINPNGNGGDGATVAPAYSATSLRFFLLENNTWGLQTGSGGENFNVLTGVSSGTVTDASVLNSVELIIDESVSTAGLGTADIANEGVGWELLIGGVSQGTGTFDFVEPSDTLGNVSGTPILDVEKRFFSVELGSGGGLGSLDDATVTIDNYSIELLSVALIPGDADGDGDVDDTDLGIAISNFTGPAGDVGKTVADGDTDGDGDVDDTDLGVMISGFTGPLSPAAVPEPASLAVLGLGGLLVARRRRA